MDKAILAGDVDRTQSYVFESNRLPEIRGASRMLDDIGDEAGDLVKDSKGDLILQGGGSLLAIVDPAHADDLVHKIETLYLRKACTATITVGWRLATDAMLRDGIIGTSAVFGGLLDWAAVWLRRQKDGRDVVPWIEAPPHVERCRSCHIRPATPASYKRFPDWPLCAVCLEKRNYKRRDFWFSEFQDFLEKTSSASRSYYRDGPVFPKFEKDQGTAPWTPQDLDEIGQCCHARPGYVGMIYLDGDNMGQIFSGVSNQQDARCLSKAIRSASHQAVYDALAEYLRPQKVTPSLSRKISGEYPSGGQQLSIHPFEIITIGGDDILLIVPADQAIPIATRVSQRFPVLLKDALTAEQASRQLHNSIKNSSPSLSGGVVLASDHNPILTLWNRARELKSSAKKARNSYKSNEGYLDFCALMGTEVPDRALKAERERYPYTIELPGKAPLSLLRRPYPAGKLAEAWQALLALRSEKFSNGQMTQLAGELLQGQAHSRQYYLYQDKRSQGSSGRSHPFLHLDRALELLQGPRAASTYPWFEFQRSPAQSFGAVTALWDVAELYSFVPEKGG